MYARAKELHNHYFKPKPILCFRMFDGDTEQPDTDQSEAGQAEVTSIDIYVNLVV